MIYVKRAVRVCSGFVIGFCIGFVIGLCIRLVVEVGLDYV